MILENYDIIKKKEFIILTFDTTLKGSFLLSSLIQCRHNIFLTIEASQYLSGWHFLLLTDSTRFQAIAINANFILQLPSTNV